MPAYGGDLSIKDNPYGTGKDNQSKILKGSHTLTTTFTPKVNEAVHSIMIRHSDSTPNKDSFWQGKGIGNIIASYVDNNTHQKVTSPKKSFDTSNSSQVYTPAYFGWNKLTDFPKGTTFTVERPITITAEKNQSVFIDSDVITSQAADGTTKDLGTSNTLAYNGSGSLTLEVPEKINYGRHHNMTHDLLPIDNMTGALKIINETTDSQKVKLTADLAADIPNNSANNLLTQYLRYQIPNTNNFRPINGLLIYDGNLSNAQSNNSVDISAAWKDNNNKQAAGPMLDLRSLSQIPNIGSQSAQLTWTL
ncbi:hypothetical protein EQ500_07085, partial [Lactobacillus sp. XV13L]|nr:hypothetical protein [Lactobacillus sp. XV13L]